MLNNGNFGFPYSFLSRFPLPAFRCHDFYSHDFHPCIFATPAFSTPSFSVAPLGSISYKSLVWISSNLITPCVHLGTWINWLDFEVRRSNLSRRRAQTQPKCTSAAKAYRSTVNFAIGLWVSINMTVCQNLPDAYTRRIIVSTAALPRRLWNDKVYRTITVSTIGRTVDTFRRLFATRNDEVNTFSTWRLHVAWMYIWWVCTRAAPNENPNPNSHDHCLLSKWKCRTCVHTHLCNSTRQTSCRKRVYRTTRGILCCRRVCSQMSNGW